MLKNFVYFQEFKEVLIYDFHRALNFMHNFHDCCFKIVRISAEVYWVTNGRTKVVPLQSCTSLIAKGIESPSRIMTKAVDYLERHQRLAIPMLWQFGDLAF